MAVGMTPALIILVGPQSVMMGSPGGVIVAAIGLICGLGMSIIILWHLLLSVTGRDAVIVKGNSITLRGLSSLTADRYEFRLIEFNARGGLVAEANGQRIHIPAFLIEDRSSIDRMISRWLTQ